MKKNKPTISQYSYMVTGLLSAWIREHKEFPDLYANIVDDAVNITKYAFDRIAMICDETEEEKPKKATQEDVKYFAPSIYDKGQHPDNNENYFFGSSSDFMEQADPFKDYPWDGKPARYTDLENWLCGRGITSHRKIASIFDDSLKIGYIIKDAKTKLYSHYKSYNPSLRP